MPRVGILTGGGDCPGLNAVIRAAVRAGIRRHAMEVVGFRNGWAGVLSDDAIALNVQNTAGILHRGGTILGPTRSPAGARAGRTAERAFARPWRGAASTR